MSVDYKDTVFLPKTEFPMKAGLPKREPEILQRWAEIDLWGRLRAASAGREKFILHDGPPYANGHLHIGHALNKILKDVISRSQQMLGKDANYVPGWDCHGLPIEWKIEEEYRADGRDKDQVPIVEFRKECRDFAEKWIDIQRDEFKRLGVIGDWDKPYSTMAYAAEAQIAREIGKFLMNGGLFRGSKPVLWSVVEKTALAEAEVEYLDHKSPTVHARFPIVSGGGGELEGAAIVIWTTTPWTLPGNRAIAFDPESEYGLYEVGEVAEGSFARRGEKLVVATELAGQVKAAAGIEAWERVGGKVSLDGVVCAHPLRGFAEAEGGYDFDVPAFAADFVTMDQGTGLVHIGPGAGADDYIFAVEHGLEIPHTVAEDGSFYDHVALFAGTVVYDTEGKSGDANGAIIKVLIEAGALLAKGSLRHDYPHSWRSKAPLIFRNTAQWFISMSTNDLRQTALAAIDNTKFYPPQGRDRLYAMIAERPDWCVSRQRAWGVPIPVFVEKESGEPLRDQTVIDRITAAFEEEGADAWFASEPSRFLGNERDPADYEQVTDVVDVWFDSGSTHSFVLEHRDDLEWPASLYLEGSDQHRGWFHSSLLEACGTRGRAPYDGVLTHGFVMAEDGRKMSKSLGNIVSPQEVTEHQGAEILRLWVVASDYSEDLRIGPEILKRQVDAYRRLRNTLRYLLGNLHRFDPKQRVRAADMPELERWVLHRLWEIDAKVRTCCADFDFHAMFRELYNFCTSDLSAFYFDIRKDCLYCDSAESPRRRAAETVLDETYSCLTAWLAPILCFTAEEAWLVRNPADGESVHLRTFPEVPAGWRDDDLAAKWARIRRVRRVVTGAIEIERGEKRLGSSLQAAPEVYVTQADAAALDGIDLAEIAITSDATMIEGAAPKGAFVLDDVAGIGVVPKQAAGEKCERCWRVLPEVGEDSELPGTCGRCADAVRGLSELV
jgi:isoleucyl-tRNA synthetase